MIPSEIIEKKRDGKNLNKKELKWFITEYINNRINESQMSALLMAIYFRGMIHEEMYELVNIMVGSGKKCNFNNLDSYVADKHSTGGVGDKISFILAPILASLDISIPMIAGKSLAYTGGTIDKLESIKNVNLNLNLNQLIKQVKEIGLVITGQSKELCPADRKIYALRDLTGTIPSLPLICSSIMSKKIAEDLDGLIIDLKVGSGTFMKNINQAKELGNNLKNIGEAFNINTEISFTNMNQPLGNYAGLKYEILEALDCLKGNYPDDIIEVTLNLGSKILLMSKHFPNEKVAKSKMLESINSGAAYKKFSKMISAQGGDLEEFIASNQSPKENTKILSNKEGYLNFNNTEKIGWALIEMGCGRKSKKDRLDYTAGLKINAKNGDYIKKGDLIFNLFGKNIIKLKIAKKIINKAFTISEKEIDKENIILNI